MAIIDTEKLTEDELKLIGAQVVVEWFDLKKDKTNANHFKTQFGTKTLLGLGSVAVRLVKEKGKPV
jgi:hypothetical protein